MKLSGFAARSGSISWPKTKSQMYSWPPFGFLGSSPLDTEETAKEYDFEWYHDVSDLDQGDSYMQLGVKWKQKSKTSRMFVAVKLS